MGRGLAEIPGDNAMSPAETPSPKTTATIHEVRRDNLILILTSKWPATSNGRRDRADVPAFLDLVSPGMRSFRKLRSPALG